METIIQSIVDHSKIEILELDVSEPRADTIRLSLKARITGLGPIHAQVSPMAVKLRGSGGIFAELQLAPIYIDPTGGDIIVEHQEIRILDLAAFETFVRAAVLDNTVTLDIVEGRGIMYALGLSTPANFHKNMTVRGMEYIQIDVLALNKITKPTPLANISGGVPIEATIRLQNPSPFQIEVGRVVWALTNDYQVQPGQARSGSLVDKLSLALHSHMNETNGADLGEQKDRKLFAQFAGSEPLTILRSETLFTLRGVVQPSMDQDAIKNIADTVGIPLDSPSSSTASTYSPSDKDVQYYPCRLKGVKVESVGDDRSGEKTGEVADWMHRIAQIIDLPVGVPVNPELAGMFITV